MCAACIVRQAASGAVITRARRTRRPCGVRRQRTRRSETRPFGQSAWRRQHDDRIVVQHDLRAEERRVRVAPRAHARSTPQPSASCRSTNAAAHGPTLPSLPSPARAQQGLPNSLSTPPLSALILAEKEREAPAVRHGCILRPRQRNARDAGAAWAGHVPKTSTSRWCCGCASRPLDTA